MKNKILGNQSGVSLMETVVAASISIVIAMGVVQINQNANQGMAKIQRKANLMDFSNTLRMKVSQRDTGGVNHCDAYLADFLGTNDMSSPINVADGTQFWASWDGGVDKTGEPMFTVGQEVPGGNGLTIVSARMTGNYPAMDAGFWNQGSGSNQGRCDIVLGLRSRDMDAGQIVYKVIPIMCTVVDQASDQTLTSCSATIDTTTGDDGTCFMDNDGAGDIMKCAGGVGDPRMEIGSPAASAAALTIQPDPTQTSLVGWATHAIQPDPTQTSLVGGATHAIDLDANSAITFGTGTADTTGIYYDEGGDQLVVEANYVRMSGSLGVADQIETVTVWSSNYFYTSDERYKKDIENLGSVVDKLEDIKGVTYFMRKDEFPEMNFDDKKKIGLIAQDVEKVFPELVSTNPETGYKAVQYGNFVAVLLEAIKEQQDEIESNREMLGYLEGKASMKDREQDIRIENLERENQQLRDELNAIRERLDLLIQNR